MRLTFAMKCLVVCSMAHGFYASAAEIDVTHGSSKGIMTADPRWSAGVQIGTGSTTGVSAQQHGFADGCLNLGLGLAHGGPSVSADYVVLMDREFIVRNVTHGYNSVRGILMPYFGGGITVDDGFTLKGIAGLQYTMMKDPFNFFGSVMPNIGRFLGDKDTEFNLWLTVGARVLL